MLVANKIDAEGASDRLDIVKELFASKLSLHVIAAEHGTGLEELRTAVYQFLNVIRVYTKVPGKPADRSHPFTVPEGSNVVDLARAIHRDFEQTLKYAKVWGTGVFEGQTVKRDHVLHDADVVELHV